ncbi:TonB-dependent receptor [Anseongella ginsenosidimutans]|nr:TonB-dependent receptor [Anseongella ginsenosidimutans]QEC53438.1 TonB-dependent receptor [Anseongella ginsenosidimutans]
MRGSFVALMITLLSLQMVHSSTGKAQGILDRKISISIENASLAEVLEQIREKTGVEFLFSSKINSKKEVSLEIKSARVRTALKRLLLPAGLTYEVVGEHIVIMNDRDTPEPLSMILELQEYTVSGTVTDAETGEPLPGVNVTLKGGNSGATTGPDGAYNLEVPEAENEERVLVFTFIGYLGREVPLNGQTEVNVTLRQDIVGLDQVVVIGYGTQKKSDLTGSVSQVKAEEINAYPSANVLQALSGRAAGVQVLQTTGAPGSGPNVRIRGQNSIQGENEPLYVVDGFPVSGSNPTLLNNSDIESIEILKDASATAIYGSRGANGVVLITTKQGRAGKTMVDFETSYSSQRIRNKLELMNAREYALLANEQAENDNIAPYFSQEEINGLGEGFDWQDLVFQTAPMRTTSLNVRGGNQKTQFALSGSVFGQEGIVKGSDYNRYSLRANVNHQVSDKFRVTLSSTMSKLKTERKDNGGGSRGNSMIGAAISAPPILEPYEEDGSYTVLSEEYPFIPVDLVNPLNFLNEQHGEIKANVVLANAALIYNPVKELTIKISGGVENRDERTDSYTTRNFYNSTGRANINTKQFTSLLSENIISYTKTFNDRHDFSAMAGFTYQDFVNTSLEASGVGFLSDAFETHNIGASQTPGIPRSGYSKSVLLSYLARLNYTLDSKYLFTVSFRSDGSSRFSEGNKWGYFPSGAFAWRASEENFLKDHPQISELKVRTSWGLTGSQAIDPYATLNNLSAGNTIFGDQMYNTFAPGTELPGELKWETTEQFDVGVDLGLFKNRLYLTADYYVKNTRDLLNTVRLPSSMGFTTTIQNVGKMQNRGIELGIDAKAMTGDFKWDLFGNISFNKNEVVKLHNGEDILGNFINVLVVGDNFSILREGRSVGQFWGYKEEGYDENGKITYQDLNGDGAISNDDKTYIGNPNPDFIYGLTSDMSYKNFQLSIFVQGTQGNDVFNVSSIPSTMDYGQGLNMPREVFLDHWTPGNTDAKYPVISRNYSVRVSDRWVEDGSFLRLKNVQLAYNFPMNDLGVKWLNSAQIYISGQNLLTLTNYSWWDPEVNSRGAGTQQGIDHYSYPVAKTFTIGLRAGF